ncbi:FecCD family ABC transporter permease [Jiangella anatolica]|uniref:FecCD family ABC transporter permease n=1 Tax=Jiangella anatolica TaxID=2670374 RepID=UPI0018F44D6A|nr:iron chelate uptake ABC transporter family permease subunit [Jiangella anatolica]
MTAVADASPAPAAGRRPGRQRPGGPAARRRAIGIALAAGALLCVCLASIVLGSKPIPLAEVVDAFTDPGAGGENVRIVLDLRLPRTVTGIVVGVALGLAGAVIQALTRNPLGDPGLLGVDAGAAVFVTVGVVVFGTVTPLQDLAFAVAGALVVTAAVAGIGSVRGVADPIRLTLAGIAVAAVLTGITTALMLLNPDSFHRLQGWKAGTFVERGWDVVLPVVPFLAASALLALALARALNSVGLGEDAATALGVNVARTRLLSVVAITVLAGGATAIAGPIAFVGLMVPHVARWLIGPDQRRILLLSMLLAPTLVLASDVVGRLVLAPGELPVGIVTAFVGAPVLIALARRARASAL